MDETNPHLLSAADAARIGGIKPGGVEVYDSGPTPAPQQGMVVGLPHYLFAGDAGSCGGAKTAGVEVYRSKEGNLRSGASYAEGYLAAVDDYHNRHQPQQRDPAHLARCENRTDHDADSHASSRHRNC